MQHVLSFGLSFYKLNPAWMLVIPALTLILGAILSAALVYFWAWRRERFQGIHVTAAIEAVTWAIANVGGDPNALENRLLGGINSMILSTTGATRAKALAEILNLSDNNRTMLALLANTYTESELRAAAEAFAKTAYRQGRTVGLYADNIVLFAKGERTMREFFADISAEEAEFLEGLKPKA